MPSGAILARDPAAARRSLYAAAALADTDAAFALLDADPASADRPGGRRAWKPLLYLCSSRYRRAELGAARAAIARRLIALGAALTGREPGLYFHPRRHDVPGQRPLRHRGRRRAAAPAPELVRVLLEAGADLKQTTVALLQAVRGGNLEVLNLLLAALPREVSWQANWALQESVVADRMDMVRILADRVELPAQGAIREAIQLARDPAMIEILLGGNEPSWRRGSVEHQAYQWAVRYGNRAAAALLRARGAGPGRGNRR